MTALLPTSEPSCREFRDFLPITHKGSAAYEGAPIALTHKTVATNALCIYTMDIQFTWDEAKRRSNTKDHGFDFVDAATVFAGWTVTLEDDRFHYPEQRLITLGLLNAVPVSIVHTETDVEVHLISFRKATRKEAKFFYESIKDGLETHTEAEGLSNPRHKRTP